MRDESAAIDPAFAARAYTPGRIAVMPPDVFLVLDQVGDNDPTESAALASRSRRRRCSHRRPACGGAGTTSISPPPGTAFTAPDGTLLVSADE